MKGKGRGRGRVGGTGEGGPSNVILDRSESVRSCNCIKYVRSLGSLTTTALDAFSSTADT